ncbi:MAG TPA: hypothetical protein VFG63_08280 [Nocardioidaceae bacterium]|nr:hypothetical protein [Nocardioidaceae bacterium]
MPKRVVVALVTLVLLLVLAAGGLLAWRWLDTSDYEQAVATMPASTLRASYTDWAQVRRELDASGVHAGSSGAEVDDFLDAAYRADLTSTSAVYGSTAVLAHRYGFSPLGASWEMFGQSREGAVVAMRLPESADFPGIERHLRTLGYDAPAEGAGSGQVWQGSVDLVAQIDASLTPVFQNIVVLEDERLVLLSDSAAYASSSAEVARGDADSLASGDAAEDLAGVADEPVSAVLWGADFACEDLSMAAADDEDQSLADQLVDEAGGVNPLSGLVMARQPDHSLVVGMRFEDSDQAEANLRPRAELASGEAVGQGGMFPDRFRIASAKTTGASVVLHLEPTGDPAESTLLSDLSHGPVLFATC